MIEKIKAEIERLRKTNEISEDKEYAQYELDVSCGYDSALDDIASFIESLEKEQEPKGYDEAYIKEKIALATKNGSWRESPEKEQYAGETMVEKDKIDTAFTRMMEKEQDAAKDLQWAAMEYASKAALLSSSTAGWRTSDITDAYKAGYEHGCRHAAVLYDDMEKERQRRCENEPTIKGWVARDCCGRLSFFECKPKYKEGVGLTHGFWAIVSGAAVQLNSNMMPDVNVRNSPIEVELTIHRV